MGELYKSTNFTMKELPGFPGMYAWRCTAVQSGDILTLPCAKIEGHSEQDETTAAVIKVALATNVLTITCTNGDTISGIAIVTK
jgi:hypothetical protein